MNIAILDDYLECALQFAPFRSLDKDHNIEVFTRTIPAEALPVVLSKFDVLLVMRERTALPGTLIRQLTNLKLIITTGRRNDVIDLEACKTSDITVCGTDSPAQGTAELTLGLILAAAKGLIVEHNSMCNGGWQTRLATDLQGSTLGIIGLGRLGGMLSGYAHALGMKTVAWSTNLTAERAEQYNVKLVTKEELMAGSDFVSIHLRLSDRTWHLIKASDLAIMKEGAWIVNTSRSQIVDTDALIQSLKTGKINAALDVFDMEPLPEDSELRRLPNVILSPHKGFVSQDTFKVFYQQSYQALIAWLDNKPIDILL
jgi:phosphoglycerate dehydrogenase-like enzyme